LRRESLDFGGKLSWGKKRLEEEEKGAGGLCIGESPWRGNSNSTSNQGKSYTIKATERRKGTKKGSREREEARKNQSRVGEALQVNLNRPNINLSGNPENAKGVKEPEKSLRTKKGRKCAWETRRVKIAKKDKKGEGGAQVSSSKVLCGAKQPGGKTLKD